MFKNVYSLYSAFCTQPAFYSQSAVCILHSVCILPLVRSLQSAVRSLRLTLTALSILPEKREGRSNRAAGSRAWWPVPGTQILERRESKRHTKSFLPFYLRSQFSGPDNLGARNRLSLVRREKSRRKVSLSVFSLAPDLLFDCSRVYEYAKIRTVLQSLFQRS